MVLLNCVGSEVILWSCNQFSLPILQVLDMRTEHSMSVFTMEELMLTSMFLNLSMKALCRLLHMENISTHILRAVIANGNSDF